MGPKAAALVAEVIDRLGHIIAALLAAACIFITANRLDAF